MQEIDQPILWYELKAAVTKLTNDRDQGLNKVPPNVFKALNDENLTQLLRILNNYLLEETDFDEWHKGQIVPVPKIGNLFDPNKWRGFTLTNIRANMFRSILCGCALNIIKSCGVKYQFGSTPGVGWQNGRFTRKTLLHLRHNHKLPSLVVFSDTVKYFDTYNHKILITILSRYGCPPRFFLR